MSNSDDIRAKLEFLASGHQKEQKDGSESFLLIFGAKETGEPLEPPRRRFRSNSPLGCFRTESAKKKIFFSTFFPQSWNYHSRRRVL
jgi:hypothetical protein